MVLVAVRCQGCGTVAEVERVGVRDVCARCTAYLHCCRNCAFYEPGRHNDCREPNAQLVADKEAGNFCDYFRPAAHGAAAATPSETRARLDALFKKW
ncbi:MAG: hypothetical protein E6J83_07940 [Deltaproteobacteria bacterium]|nr:MAG: hypothetical protein E6J83_07940 [Deltaproteobacteria bacterium]